MNTHNPCNLPVTFLATRLGLLAVASLCVAITADRARAEEAPAAWIESFDRAWEIVRDKHYDPGTNGVDWAAVRDELRPKALAATTLAELREVIEAMLARLGQSHFELLPGDVQDALEAESSAEDDAPGEDESDPKAAADESDADDDSIGEIGVDLRLLGTEMVVLAAPADQPAHTAGVRPGWAIATIGDKKIGELLEILPKDLDERMRALYARQLVRKRLEGRVGTHVNVGFTNPAGESVELRLRRVAGPPRVSFGDLPPLDVRFSEKTLEHEGSSYGYIAFNIWLFNVARPFDEAIDTHRARPGIIIDLRGNPGGIGGMAMGLAGHFLTENLSLGTMKTRKDELRFVANPRFVDTKSQPVDPYAGPLAILVDGGTASTSEIFAAGLKHLGRARIFGETTMGAALPAATERLPCGDVFLYAFADYLLPDGTRIEGRGVIPDENVTLTRAALASGADPVVASALAWLAKAAKQ